MCIPNYKCCIVKKVTVKVLYRVDGKYKIAFILFNSGIQEKWHTRLLTDKYYQDAQV